MKVVAAVAGRRLVGAGELGGDRSTNMMQRRLQPRMEVKSTKPQTTVRCCQDYRSHRRTEATRFPPTSPTEEPHWGTRNPARSSGRILSQR